MTKIIEYEVGEYSGHPVVIRFANVSEENARELAMQMLLRLQIAFDAKYPLLDGASEFVKGARIGVELMGGDPKMFDVGFELGKQR